MRLNIQLFGGRGATSSEVKSKVSKGAFNQYFKNTFRDALKNKAFKYGKNDVITDTYSMYFLNKTGLEYGKKEQVKNLDSMVKDIDKQIKDASGFQSINSYITSEKYINVDSNDRFTQGYGFDTSRIKRAKIFLGKDAQATIVYNKAGQPAMAFKNKKGERGWLLPIRSI